MLILSALYVGTTENCVDLYDKDEKYTNIA